MKLHDLIDFGGLSSGVLALQTRNTTNIHDEFSLTCVCCVSYISFPGANAGQWRS